MNCTIEEPYRSLNQFWTPAEKNFLARERDARRAGKNEPEVVLPNIRVANAGDLEIGVARVREAMMRFREVMRITDRSVPRDEFREIQKFYYSTLRFAQALGRGAFEVTRDPDLAHTWMGALMRTPEFRSFGRISDRFRQQTKKYREKKQEYDARRNVRPEVKGLRQTAEARDRINRNARARYHLQRLRDVVARTRRHLGRGSDDAALRDARTEVTRLYTRVQELRWPDMDEAEREAKRVRAVDAIFGDLRRVA